MAVFRWRRGGSERELRPAWASGAPRSTITGFEARRVVQQGPLTEWIAAIGGGTEVHFLSRRFGSQA